MAEWKLMWAFISLVLAVVLVTAFYNPVSASINEAYRTRARFLAQDIASGVNMLGNAPDGTSYDITIPKTDCTIDIYNTFVRVSASDNIADSNFNVNSATQKTAVVISLSACYDPNNSKHITIMCNQTTEKTLIAVKSGNNIIFREGVKGIECKK